MNHFVWTVHQDVGSLIDTANAMQVISQSVRNLLSPPGQADDSGYYSAEDEPGQSMRPLTVSQTPAHEAHSSAAEETQSPDSQNPEVQGSHSSLQEAKEGPSLGDIFDNGLEGPYIPSCGVLGASELESILSEEATVRRPRDDECGGLPNKKSNSQLSEEQ